MICDDYNAMDVFGEWCGYQCPPDFREFYTAMFARVDAEIAASYQGEVSDVTRNALYIQAVHDDCPEFADCLWATNIEDMDAAIAAFDAKYPPLTPFNMTVEDVERILSEAETATV